MKNFLLLSLVLLLNSCIASLQPVSLDHREYDGIKEGIIEKDLGDPLIIKGIEKYSKGIKMETSVSEIMKKQLGIVYAVNLSKGEILYFGGTDESRDFYFSDTEIETGHIAYKQGVAIDRTTQKKYLVFRQDSYFLDKEFDFNYSEIEYNGKDCNECFKQELIYNGKSGNTIQIVYREFSNNMARPAFTQNLSYDLAEGDLISFKGCKLKVLNAKNTGIDFKILSTFD